MRINHFCNVTFSSDASEDKIHERISAVETIEKARRQVDEYFGLKEDKFDEIYLNEYVVSGYMIITKSIVNTL